LLPKISGVDVLRSLNGTRGRPNSDGRGQRSLGKNRRMLIETGADDYLEKCVLEPDKGVNLLPKLLEDVLCRIQRKRGVGFSRIMK